MSTQLEAIVLKNFNYQDNHKIVKMLSPSHGLISVFISYANKKKSRYGALAQPLTTVMITVKPPASEGDGLYYLQHGEIISSHYVIKCDYDKVMLFYEMADIILRGDINPHDLPFAYRTLRFVLMQEEATDLQFRWLTLLFKAKMIIPLGIAPQIDHCISCGTIEKIVTASVSLGGLVCQNCYANDGIWLEATDIPLWRALFKYPIDRLYTLPIEEIQLQKLQFWLSNYYETYSNISTKTKKFT